jgi:hypothetical protein
MSVRHSAPRRQVVFITRTEGYGNTRYFHQLECGHLDCRRRPARATTIGCPRCAEDERYAALTAEINASLPATEGEVGYSVQAFMDVEAARLRAGLARLLQVDLEDVTIDSSSTAIRGAYIWVSAASLDSLRERLLS